jgi:hypothetical protein
VTRPDPFLGRWLTQLPHFGFELPGEAGALTGLLAEKRFQVRGFGVLGRVLASLLTVTVVLISVESHPGKFASE